MALGNVLARLPGIAGYEAAGQQQLQQASGLASLLRMQQQMQLAQAQEQRIGALQQAQLAEIQRKAALQQEGLAGLQQGFDVLFPGASAIEKPSDELGGGPGRPAVQDPKAAILSSVAKLDPAHAATLATRALGLGGLNGVTPMEIRYAQARDAMLSRADAAEASGDTATAERLRQDAKILQDRLQYMGGGQDRFERQQSVREARFADETGQPLQQRGATTTAPAPAAQTAVPAQANDVVRALEGEIAGTQYRLAEATRLGDAQGVQREQQNMRVLAQKVQELQGGSSQSSPVAQAATGLPPKSARDVEVERRKQEIKIEGANKKEMFELNAKQYNEFRAKIPELNSSVRALDRLNALIDRGESFSNAGAEFKAQLSSVAQALKVPINIKALADSEEYQAQIAELLKARLGSKDYGSGTGVSNLDLIAASKPLPELVKSRQGQKQIIQALLQDAKERRDDINAYRQHFDGNRGNMESFVFPSEKLTEERMRAMQQGQSNRSGEVSGRIRQGGPDASGGVPGGIRFMGFE